MRADCIECRWKRIEAVLKRFERSDGQICQLAEENDSRRVSDGFHWNDGKDWIQDEPTACAKKKEPRTEGALDGEDGGGYSWVAINLKTGSCFGAIAISCGNSVIFAIVSVGVSLTISMN